MNAFDIRLVLFDVDGVLTDGTIYIGQDGEVLKSFNAKDGVAVALLQKHDIKVGVISGKASKALDFRIKQLNFDYTITGCNDKFAALNDIKNSANLKLDQIAFVGDDIIDIPVMTQVGLSIAPSDAHELAINCANHVTSAKGGEGVARESAEFILKNAGFSMQEMYSEMVDNVIQ